MNRTTLVILTSLAANASDLSEMVRGVTSPCVDGVGVTDLSEMPPIYIQMKVLH